MKGVTSWCSEPLNGSALDVGGLDEKWNPQHLSLILFALELPEVFLPLQALAAPFTYNLHYHHEIVLENLM